jgi:hypothetical protein
VTMGTEMKDPQTGQSLGRIESPCCELTVDRVTPHLSYGHLDNVRGPLDKLLPGALQVREPLPPAAPAAQAATAATTATTAKAPAKGTPKPAAQDAPAATEPTKKDEKW